MRLRIDNFAKIRHADIKIDGITVIAGENNTGKSTIGKALYSMFNSLHDLDEKIDKRREDEIYEICSRYIRNLNVPGTEIFSQHSVKLVSRKAYDRIAKEITKALSEVEGKHIDSSYYAELVKDICNKNDVWVNYDQIKDYVDATLDKVAARKANDNYKIALELIQRFFGQIFGSQMQCLKELESEAKLLLTIKDKNISIGFRENQCVSLVSDYNILHEAFFLDDPFVLDDLSNDFYLRFSKGIRGQLQRRLCDAETDIMKGIFDAVDAKEQLKEIYRILNQVTEGDVLLQAGQWRLMSEQFEEPVNFENLSAGLKSFVLIKILLEKGILKEKDVLILDEPEIHLHPEWQLFYAEIIVLLQKQFDLSIVVTTHSSHFLEAIECFSQKYGIDGRCNYYLSNKQNGLAVFEDVTGSLSKIYKQMVSPNILLDRLKYEMEEVNE